MTAESALFLGLDASTQSLKAVVVDRDLKLSAEFTVKYDDDLPEYRTTGGVHRGADGRTVTSPPLMWVAALDLLFQRMKQQRFPFARVAAISGSGQQHGSVHFRKGARAILQRLSPDTPLHRQLAAVFAVGDSPVWMDFSTTAQCRALEQALGGPQALARLTGSRAFERFTGNQIAKIAQTQRANYENTERIALVSSFFASLLTGDYAPIDTSDGSGMNLMDVRRKVWSRRALEATAPDLEARLGPLVPGHTVVGRIHAHFVERYGFAPETLVVAFSGDNPCSLAGLRLQRSGDVAISLGTSDTMFAALARPRPSAYEGHIFANPVDPKAYMAMIVYKNGSLTREHVRELCGCASWADFEALLAQTAPGNRGHIGFYHTEPEITPPVHQPGIHRFGPGGRRLRAFPPAVEARAVIEGQFLSMRLHGGRIGIRPAKILVTGGASQNRAVVRVLCDVFGVPVYTGEQPNSAALGAAYRARHGWVCAQKRRFVPFARVVAKAPPFHLAAEPDAGAHRTYTRMLPVYAKLEARIADQ